MTTASIRIVRLMIKNCAERIGLSILATALLAVAADAQLKPTVNVRSTPASPVSPECVEGTAPQKQPRVEVAQLPETPRGKPMAAPRSASLRSLLEDTQSAADRADSTGFRGALVRAKEMLATYPAGGERNAATEAIGIYDDIDRVWTYEMETRAGAFFDAGTAPAEVMRKYAGYERAIADQVFVEKSGHRFYPTVETREYLLREAAQRLGRLGISVPLRTARTARSTGREAAAKTGQTASRKAEKATTAEVRPAESKRAAAEPPRKAKRKSETRTAEHRVKRAATAPAALPPVEKKEPRSVPKSEAPKPPAIAAKPAVPATHEPAKSPEVPKAAALPATSSQPPPAMPVANTATSAAPAATGSTAPAWPIATTDTTTSSAMVATGSVLSTTAVSSASTDTTGTAGKEEQRQPKGVILPIILIVVGVGVLIVLFRASS